MRIKNLFLMLLALPLAFVACEKAAPVDEIKEPTVAITTGEATETSIAFTITSTDAEEVKGEYQKVLNAFMRQGVIPGFRKGKVPLPVIKQKFQQVILRQRLCG